jgi:ferrochelatase
MLSRTIKRALSTTPPKTGIVLMNLGGPASLDQVHGFLLRLFSDPDIIPLPFQSRLGPWIAKRRTPKIQEQYKEIGGGSPILSWTQKQADMLATAMDAQSPLTGPHKAYIAFRYAQPLTEVAIQNMLDDGVTRAVAFTQYPQYSCSTTGSSLNELHRQLRVMDPTNKISWSIIDRWGDDTGFIRAVAMRVQAAIDQLPKESQKTAPILFSAHSLPLMVVNRGDTYPQEVAVSAAAVIKYLNIPNPFRVVWQSQVGPQPWLGPNTEKVLNQLVDKGVQDCVIVPIAFTSDHIETLYELDYEYIRVAKEKGMRNVVRSESLNDMPAFIEGMASLVSSHLKGSYPTTQQMYMQCPGCDKSSCQEMKSFFR